MKISILTCFPEYFSGTFCSLLGKAITKGILSINIIDIKKYGVGTYSKVDDKPAGGGCGLIMRADVIEKAVNDNFNWDNFKEDKSNKFLIMSPRGEKFCQQKAVEFSKLNEIIILCNRYEGVDQRAIEHYNMEQICVGEYILMGGETACMAVIEASCRLIDGVLNNPESIKNETFSNIYNNNIECDQYTLPRVWNGMKTPDVLLSGNHQKIAEWRGEVVPVSKYAKQCVGKKNNS
ncbi:MAG: tRNA (guanosine(37)-N1)-methyltransferase TrmD [Rickettsiales bacterium]|nr:tRNA (guanosine(37)-N1)-methyltransferase TrmD [Rickettsiales bacterium]